MHQARFSSHSSGFTGKLSTAGRESVETGLEKIILLPVDNRELSEYTFQWYVDNLAKDDHILHVCHVPTFKEQVTLGMTAQDILNIMKETNAKVAELKKKFEDLIADRRVNGKFVRIGGNSPWCALVEYGRRRQAHMIVMGTYVLGGATKESSLGLSNIPIFVPMIAGSVSLDVLMHSQLPVVLVRKTFKADLTFDQKAAVYDNKSRSLVCVSETKEEDTSRRGSNASNGCKSPTSSNGCKSPTSSNGRKKSLQDE